MVDVLGQDEGAPSSYPPKPSGLSAEADALDPAGVWQRIEGWIARRWGERTVTWIVAGPGVWSPNLKPTSVDSAEVWDGETWTTTTLAPAPTGYDLDHKTYKITATVGTASDPPEAVLEAYRRYAEYVAGMKADGHAGVTSVSDGDFSMSRPAQWAARALHYSGAADLLRAFR